MDAVSDAMSRQTLFSIKLKTHCKQTLSNCWRGKAHHSSMQFIFTSNASEKGVVVGLGQMLMKHYETMSSWAT